MEFYCEPLPVLAQEGISTMGDWANCVENGCVYALFFFNTSYQGQRVKFQGYSYGGWMCWGLLLLCFTVALISAALVYSRAEFSVCSGSYMAGKWELERTCFYNFMASPMLLYQHSAYCLVACMTTEALPRDLLERLATELWWSQVAPILVMLISIASSIRSDKVCLDYQDESFKRMIFSRSWCSLLTECNMNFANRVHAAASSAKDGDFTALRKLVVEHDDMTMVLKTLSSRGAINDDKTIMTIARLRTMKAPRTWNTRRCRRQSQVAECRIEDMRI